MPSKVLMVAEAEKRKVQEHNGLKKLKNMILEKKKRRVTYRRFMNSFLNPFVSPDQTDDYVSALDDVLKMIEELIGSKRCYR